MGTVDEEALQFVQPEGSWRDWAAVLQAVLAGGSIPDDENFSKLWIRPAEGMRAGFISEGLPFWREVIVPALSLSPKEGRRLLSWVQHGVHVPDFFKPFTGVLSGREVVGLEPQSCRIGSHSARGAHNGYLKEQMALLLQRGCVVRRSAPAFMSMPLFVHEAAGTGKLRVVFDCRHLNNWTPPPPLRYEGVVQFQRGLHEGDDMFSVDMLSGYHQVAVTAESQEFLGFEYEGEPYSFTVLPFGWSCACFAFQTITSAFAAYLRVHVYHILCYLDDLSGAQAGKLPVRERGRRRWCMCAAAYSAALILSLPKCQLELRRRIVTLGVGVDTVRCQFFVPEAKLQRVLAGLREALNGSAVTVHALRSLLGRLQSLSLAAPSVGVYLVAAHRVLAKAVAAGSFTTKLGSEVVADFEDLLLLADWAPLSQWQHTAHAKVVVRLETDASTEGYGALLCTPGGHSTSGGVFPPALAGVGIALQEAYAVLFAFRSMAAQLKDRVVDLYTDNEAVRYTILRGSMRVPGSREIAKELWAFQLAHNTHVRVHRVTTHDNATADALSRGGYSAATAGGDYRLTDAAFALVAQWFGPFTIDACASVVSARCARFVVAPEQPVGAAVGQNVFLYPFTEEEMIYVYPPFPLISALWRHFRLLRCRGAMIVPGRPTETWYGIMRGEAKAMGTLSLAGGPPAVTEVVGGRVRELGPLGWDMLCVQFDFRSV
jgi:hypothetical protein